MEGRDRAAVPPGEPARGHQQSAHQDGGDAAHVAGPFAQLRAQQVEDGHRPQDGQRQPDHERFFLREAERHGRDGEAVEQRGGQIKQVADEIARAAQKAVPLSESLARPDVQAAFLRIAPGKCGHHQRGGNEKQQARRDPQGDRTRAGVRRHRQPANPHHGGDVEQNEVRQPQGAPQLFRRLSRGHEVSQSSKGPAVRSQFRLTGAADRGASVTFRKADGIVQLGLPAYPAPAGMPLGSWQAAWKAALRRGGSRSDGGHVVAQDCAAALP